MNTTPTPLNHEEAHQLAEYKYNNSNLARCYIDIAKQLSAVTDQRDNLEMELECSRLNHRKDNEFLIGQRDSLAEIINTIKSISAKWRNEGDGYSTSYEPHDIFKICADEIDQALNQPNE